MKVASKLVKMDFVIGDIERKDDYLIIISNDERSTMPAKVRMDAEDVWLFVKAMLKWSVIKYVFALPFLYRKAKKANQAKGK
jgi:hypothetical protein